MNDRPQGGSADLSQKATIELMQHRRLLRDEGWGFTDFLNETDSHQMGIKVKASYWLHIFDRTKGHSLQRSQ